MGAWTKLYNPNPNFDTLKVGDIPGNNYFEVESEGNVKLNGDSASWDDLRFPVTGQQLLSPAGRIDFNFDDCTADFAVNALYDVDLLCIIAQMAHSKLLGSVIEFHHHWFQNQNAIPNWLVGYRWINIGEAHIAAASETLIPLTQNAITYTAGNIHQLTEPAASIAKPVADTLSSILLIHLYRDTTNVSTLFAGNDPYSGDAQLIEFDIHLRKDGFGSNQEYVK